MPLQARQISEIPDHPDSPTSADKMSPSSALLQDLLREKKASQHARRTSHQSDHNAYDRQVQSSPIAPSAAGQASKSSDRRVSGNAAPKEMGLREMEEYISKINTQNFDLKLEVFHRRKRSEALEAKALKVEKLEVQINELRQRNDDLQQELEKRDDAVGEAVALICDLEAKIDELESEHAYHAKSARSPTAAGTAAEPRSLPATQSPVTPSPSPGTLKTSNLLENRMSTPSPAQADQDSLEKCLLRSPSFLRDDKPSTSALRSLFQKNGELSPKGLAMAKPSMRSLRRTGSFFSQDEYPDTVDEDTFSLNHRRLSLLSESSFVSVYGKDKEKVTPSNAQRNARTASPPNGGDILFTTTSGPQEGRIKSWIEDRDHPASPDRRPVKSARPDRFSSIGELIESNKPIANQLRPVISPTPPKKHHQQMPAQPMGTTQHKPSFAGPIFGPDVLPPTPGTMSTATLGGRSSNHSIVEERSLAAPSQPINGSPVRSNDHAYRNTFAVRSMRSEAALGVPRVFPNDDTDIEVSEDENDSIAAVPNTQDTFNYLDTLPGANNVQRRAHASNATNSMFDGEDMGAIRPARTISYTSPSRSHQSASRGSARSSGKASDAGKDGPEVGERTSSARKDVASPVDSSKSPRPFPSRSKSSHASAPSPTSNFASRLFRRTPSYHAPVTGNRPGNNVAPPSRVEPPTSSPESKTPESSKIRPPRPSSLYMRTASHQVPSAAAAVVAAPKITTPRISRLGGGAAASPTDPRRHSASFNHPDRRDGEVAGMEGSGEKVQQQQQQQQNNNNNNNNKRLSVGAIGRSASLKIKEGFGRKK
ncbi:MAG: hypothetical protein L6R35_003730 [Caloplaca aegaea]|nr:MAG: hypothetical protein L6R35_003730 [Caloplaca aegaea]